jgi:hypothetical protein
MAAALVMVAGHGLNWQQRYMTLDREPEAAKAHGEQNGGIHLLSQHFFPVFISCCDLTMHRIFGWVCMPAHR